MTIALVRTWNLIKDNQLLHHPITKRAWVQEKLAGFVRDKLGRGLG